MISRDIFFWVLPAMYAVFTVAFLTLARAEGGSVAARKGAAAFGIGVLAIILDTQREYFPGWFFTIAVPLHWLVIILTADAFLSRHGDRTPRGPAIFAFGAGLLVNFGATFIVDSVAIRVPNATLVAIFLLTMALPRFFRRDMGMLDKLVAAVMTASWACYVVRFGIYFTLDQSTEYAQNSQWSQYMLMFYFSSAISALSVAFLLALAIMSDMIERHHAASTVDPLTGIANRRGLERLFGRQEARREYGAVMVIDLDRFKDINDAHGHAAGDAVLAATAKALTDGGRGFGDVARYGGEEFVLLVRATHCEAAAELGELLRNALSATRLEAPFDAIRFTASIGVASIEADESIADSIRRADMALYRAKEAGRDRVAYARSGFSSLSPVVAFGT
jgi:diguanylate cyclase (GGDEF)-like protein